MGGSPSPAMMNAAFKRLGIDAAYSALSVKSEDLAATFDRLKADGVSGANVTTPHKSAVMPLLDEWDPVSSKIGAVNTTVRKGAGFRGLNTDSAAIVESLSEHRVTRVRNSLVIGAGGAARAFFNAAASLGCKRVTVVARNRARASRFLRDMNNAFPDMGIALVGLGDPVSSDTDLVFNASPAGSGGSRAPENVVRAMRRGTVVFDAVYRPVETELLSAAMALGCVTIRGHEMLLNQAAASFEIWTRRKAPRDVMRGALMEELGVLQV